MIKPRYLAGFTGHRKIDNSDVIWQSLAQELGALKAHLENSGGILELYASPAYGSDLIACEEAEKLGIPVHLVLPKRVALRSISAKDLRRIFGRMTPFSIRIGSALID